MISIAPTAGLEIRLYSAPRCRRGSSGSAMKHMALHWAAALASRRRHAHVAGLRLSCELRLE
jgi:hypothetical protein